jgi:transposase
VAAIEGHVVICLFSNSAQDSFPGKGRIKPQDEELKRLQRENANLREEHAILKKALVIFSKHPK